MINIKHCQELQCADRLLSKYKEHVKVETKKNNKVKHICNQACHDHEAAEHQRLHDWYLDKKRV